MIHEHHCVFNEHYYPQRTPHLAFYPVVTIITLITNATFVVFVMLRNNDQIHPHHVDTVSKRCGGQGLGVRSLKINDCIQSIFPSNLH